MSNLYKFLHERDGQIRSEHGNLAWQIGAWKEMDGEPECCERGFHGSLRIIDALQFVHGSVLARVEVSGRSDIRNDKQAWSRMRIVEAWHWTKEDSVRLAIFAAEQVIAIYEQQYPNDSRPRDAIAAAKAYLENPTDAAARAAAYAADAAAYAADAARAAAFAAYAADAADAAAYAADAAADAARAAADAADAADAAAYAAAYAADAAAYAARAARAAAYAAYAADAAHQNALDTVEEWLIAHMAEMQPYHVEVQA